MDCLGTFGCGKLKTAIDAQVLAPWVQVSINGGGSLVTVSNNSYTASPNTAVIKSFQFGQGDGCGAEIEIFDEEGGAFKNFFSKIITNLNEISSLYTIECQWGWITATNGTTSKISTKAHTFLLDTVNVDYSDKGYKFKLELKDIISKTFEARSDKVFGTDANPISLKDALTLLWKDYGVNIKTVRVNASAASATPTYSFNTADSCYSVNFKEFDWISDKGIPKGVWKAENRTPLEASHEWTKGFTTDEGQDKGVIEIWDSVAGTPTLLYVEDPVDHLTGTTIGGCMGTYIVNGGQFSPVISFTPQIKWSVANAGRAFGVIGITTDDMEDGSSGDDKKEPKGAGSFSFHGIMDYIRENFLNPIISLPKNAHKNILASGSKLEPIEAELKIQGDPCLDDPLFIRTTTIGLIVINPFHLLKSNMLGAGTACPDWSTITDDSCNCVLSSNKWMIDGVSHEISSGSYTTTLKLRLNIVDSAACLPGFDADSDE